MYTVCPPVKLLPKSTQDGSHWTKDMNILEQVTTSLLAGCNSIPCL